MALQKESARKFAEYWKGKGYEKGQSQPFWLSLLREVFGIAEPEKFITFEDQVHLDNTSFIDGYIESTHVMIEQKSLGKDLQKPIRQSSGVQLTPYEQAKRYSMELPYSKRPRWIVTSNFESFLIYDMERPGVEPQLVLLQDLPEDYWRLEFLVDDEKHRIQKEQEISLGAGEIIRNLYDALADCYGDMSNADNQKSLNKLIVRLVFCLYAEDAEMFQHGQFEEFIRHYDAADLSDALVNLFHVLDTPEEERRRGLNPRLAAFPYTNGGLFHDNNEATEDIPILTEKVKAILLSESAPFDWSAISPTIFGGIFESTLNPETRRSGGMHYTSIENIHKVIDPLFLNDLKEELDRALDIKVGNKRRDALLAFQNKMAGLKFLDPACGSGNFLTETYLSLRRLENKAIKALYGDSMLAMDDELIKVSIQQLYGIEINDFAVSVATTALWISEAQMLRETENIIAHPLASLPLKTYTNIHEGNALRMEWNDVIPAAELNYIMGNPPFLGYSIQNESQKQDMLSVLIDEKGKPYKTAGKVDYVAAWYFKAAQMMQIKSSIKAALVSTNSITQGEQVSSIWEPLIRRYGVTIDFAWRTFIWDSEASQKAHVHCVIVGFSVSPSGKKRRIYEGQTVKEVAHINPYLIEADDVFIYSRTLAIGNVPQMTYGNKPVDGGALIIEKTDYPDFISKDPESVKYIKRLMGAKEQINGTPRYCLWLKGVSPAEMRKMPLVMERVSRCRETRLASPDEGARKLGDTPHLFRETYNPETAIVIPCHSSENRRYIPMSFIDSSVIVTNAVLFIPDGDLYLFGLLNSEVHMAWMRLICGRIKSDYRYSKDIVYNNFPWPHPTDAQIEKISQTAQAILDARALYPESSLADLYDELSMPIELRKAHRANDAAVLEAYGFPKDTTESDIVARLFKMYQALTASK